MAQTLDQILSAPHRSPEFVERDIHTHPRETLTFFGIKPHMTVVEIWPTTGGYTEILGPYLKESGRYIAVNFPPDHKDETCCRQSRELREKIEADQGLYGRPLITQLAYGDYSIAPEQSADMVLCIRNLHNFLRRTDYLTDTLAACRRVLKPGGVFGIVEHRAHAEALADPHATSGYMSESSVIESVTKAGFTLMDRSEVNANPKDTKDYAKGVWSLPPLLWGHEKDPAEYQRCMAIGESDRMTLKFVRVD